MILYGILTSILDSFALNKRNFRLKNINPPLLPANKICSFLSFFLTSQSGCKSTSKKTSSKSACIFEEMRFDGL